MSETKAVVVGTVIEIGTVQEVGSNGFTKRQLVVKTEGQYGQEIPIDFVKEKCSILDGYCVNQQVEVECNFRGSEYNGKRYLSLQGWKIKGIGAPPMDNTPTNDPPF
jgi:hypothetical protein